MISKDTIPYLIITIYLLLTAWIGITVSRQQESTPEQYFIADKLMCI